jgi:DNA modification methylase
MPPTLETLIPEEWPGDAKGFDPAALKRSSNDRAALIAMYGGRDNLPSSIIKADKYAKVSDDLDEHGAKRSYKNTAPYAGAKTRTKQQAAAAKIRGGGARRGNDGGALSIFPQNVGRTTLLFYSEPGQQVYDPFAGHNSRMDLCVNNGRHYAACDASEAFMEFNERRAARLRKKFPTCRIDLRCGDSREPHYPDDFADFTITSPPYWCVEYYGPEEIQLGQCPTYRKFMDGMQAVLEDNYRVLKPGAYAAYFVNDFRLEGVFYSYHSDLIRRARKAGFVQEDILIVDLGRGYGDVFLNRSCERRIIPKRHEYGLIFRKPDNEPETE